MLDGHVYDGTSYYRARYYDPIAGRFLSEDPARFLAGINSYVYVQNSPTQLVDPEGLSPKPKKPYRWRECNASEVQQCATQCGVQGKTYESCRVSQTYRILRLDDGPVWADGPVSCSCNEPPDDSCREKLKRLSQPTNFELDQRKKSADYMVNFWKTIVYGDIALGVVGVAGATGLLGGAAGGAGGVGPSAPATPPAPPPVAPPVAPPIALKPAA